MRKFLLCPVLAFTVMNAFATELTVEQALAKAFRQNSSRGLMASPNTSGLDYKLLSTGKENNQKTYYICNSLGKTWVLSANEIATPVLAVIDEPLQNIEDAPPAMKWLLSTYSEQIASASNNASTSSSLQYNNVTRSPARANIAPLIKTKWSQGAPYNNYCPIKNGQRTATGCVATAMAQVVNYHKWPVDSITGLPDPSSKGKEWNTSIEWDKLRDSYKSGTSAEEDNAVAKLMLACGASVNMSYDIASAGGSSATTAGLGKGLVEYFGYDKSLDAYSRYFFSTEEWHDMIYKDLEKGLPVLFGAMNAVGNGGHEFIIEGFQDGLFYVNWGWSGSADGRYALEALNPTSTGTGSEPLAQYNVGQVAFLGVQPPQEGSLATPYMGIYRGVDFSIDAADLKITAKTSGIANLSIHSGEIQLGYIIKDLNSGEMIDPIFTEPETYYPNKSVSNFWLDLPSLNEGNYEFTLVYTANGSQPKRFLHTQKSNDSVIIRYKEHGVIDDGEPGSLGNIDANEEPNVDNIKYYDLKGNQMKKEALNKGSLYIETKAGNKPQRFIKF